MSYLESDEDFRLHEHFYEGRILTKGNIVKANLLLKTHLNEHELLESFFHLELWNAKIKKYQLINRIDEGIYIIYL